MNDAYQGNYPIETRRGELERLHVQGDAMAPDTRVMLDRIGVAEGWRCLDIGCGPRGVTDILSEYAGASGAVTGLDMNSQFLEIARAEAQARGRTNVRFVQGDAYASPLEPASFDLVHMRFVASTAGEPERLIAEAKRLARPGGVIALQEPDASTLVCHPPHIAWDNLKAALLGVFSGVGADIELARRLYAVVRSCGLDDVQYRPFIVGVRAGDPMVDYLPATVESLRATVLKLGLMREPELNEALAACRAHLRQPAASFTMYTVAQVWGRTPR